MFDLLNMLASIVAAVRFPLVLIVSAFWLVGAFRHGREGDGWVSPISLLVGLSGLLVVSTLWPNANTCGGLATCIGASRRSFLLLGSCWILLGGGATLVVAVPARSPATEIGAGISGAGLVACTLYLIRMAPHWLGVVENYDGYAQEYRLWDQNWPLLGASLGLSLVGAGSSVVGVLTPLLRRARKTKRND